MSKVVHNKYKGSSTAIMAKFDDLRCNFVKTAIIGDSGLMILRPSLVENEKGQYETKLQVIGQSKVKNKCFEKPMLCGEDQPYPYWRTFPEEFECMDKDIIILYSDGVSDNLYQQDVIDHINIEVDGMELTHPYAAARSVAKQAYNMSRDENYESPYAKESKKAGRKDVQDRGVEDDITVVCT